MKRGYNINHSLSVSYLFDIRLMECIQVTNTEMKINVDKTILSLISFQNILVGKLYVFISVMTVFMFSLKNNFLISTYCV